MNDADNPSFAHVAYNEAVLERLPEGSEARDRRREFVAAIDAVSEDRLRSALLMIFDDLNGVEWDAAACHEVGESLSVEFDVFPALPPRAGGAP